MNAETLVMAALCVLPSICSHTVHAGAAVSGEHLQVPAAGLLRWVGGGGTGAGEPAGPDQGAAAAGRGVAAAAARPGNPRLTLTALNPPRYGQFNYNCDCDIRSDDNLCIQIV